MLRASAMVWPLTALAVACAVLGWVYAPGVSGPAVFDDFVVLSALDGASASWAQALDVISRDDSGPIGRPVAIASFVLEDAVLGDSLRTSKGVNIGIHCLNLVLAAWLFVRLLRVGTAHPARVDLWVALLAACAWAFSPLLVSTTLYTVQRMAMLSCSFSLVTLLLYDYWRAGYRASRLRQLCFAAAMLLSAALAALSKENAVVLPLLILLLEMAWYRWEDTDGHFSRARCRWWLIALGLTLVGGILVLILEWSRFAAGYAMRDFTLGGRLIAQGSILWDYLGQLLWPQTQRLGLYHDDAALRFATEGSLRSWLLLLSWPLMLLLPALLFSYRSLARLSVCLALFFTAHLTESTVIPLELYFEHRNYFPAVFVFLAFAYALTSLLRAVPALLAPTAALLSLALMLQLSLTSVQVQLWSSESLWRMAQLRGHPQSYRANYDMAVELASHGALPGALRYSDHAYALADELPLDLAMRNVLLDCLSGGAGGTVDALAREEAGSLTALHTLRTLVSFIEDSHCPSLPAAALADRLSRLIGAPGQEVRYPLTYFLLALLENSLGRSDAALVYTQRYLALVDNDVEALLMQLHLALTVGNNDVARTTRERLAALEAQALLTSRQRATLALYAE